MEKIPSVNELVQKATITYKEIFNSEPDIAACAPGRVNIIGEHTDYNDGLVLPMALPLVTIVVGKANETDQCDIYTLAEIEDNEGRIKFGLPCNGKKLEPGNPQWANYVKGVIANFKGELPGFNMVICTSVPLGGGLSSSASLEVATFTFLECLTGTTVKLKEKALLCQKAEHEFAGMPCGIMDQFISTMGKSDHALLIDCQNYSSKLIPIKNKDVVFLITNSNIKHKLTGSEYPQRRSQCQNAATLLGEPSLRNVKLEQLEVLKNLQVDKKTIDRAKHVILEIKRTADAAVALENNDYEKMGKLMNESHNSLQYLFEVSCPEIDILVEAARSVTGVLGSRITGGGFGGCTVTLVYKNSIDKLIKTIKERYKFKATFYLCEPSDGAKLLKLN